MQIILTQDLFPYLIGSRGFGSAVIEFAYKIFLLFFKNQKEKKVLS